MLKYTKQSVIAFDFKEALSFEGETGPYAQYAVVRATSIFRKAGFDPDTFLADIDGKIAAADLAKFSGRRICQRNLGAVAGFVQDILRDRSVHRHHRTCVSGQARVPAGAAFQSFLSLASHPERSGREAEAIPAGYRRCRAPRTNSMPGSHGHHRAAGHVEYVALRRGRSRRMSSVTHVSPNLPDRAVPSVASPHHPWYVVVWARARPDRNDLREHLRGSRSTIQSRRRPAL